jgi:molecular chaperone GrpE
MSKENKEASAPEEKPIEETAAEPAEKTAEAAPAEKTAEPEKKEPSEADKLREKLKKAQDDLAAEKDKNLRLRAEYDNFRKRSAKERDNIYADVKADTLLKILPIFDNLERALRQETADEAYRKGVEMTMNQFLEALKALGATPIETEGKTFDPHEHNAVMHTEDPEKGENVIVQEFQKGFKLGDRVIRFSMVQVAN